MSLQQRLSRGPTCWHCPCHSYDDAPAPCCRALNELAAAAAARAKSEEASVLETTNTLFLLGHLGHNPGYAPVQVRRGE